MGQRGKDLEGFLGDFLLTMLGHRRKCAHIVKTVGQLDHHNSQVMGHRQQNLAQVGCAFVRLTMPLFPGQSLRRFRRGQLGRRQSIDTCPGLGLIAGLEVSHLQLGDSVHEIGNLFAKFCRDLFPRDAAIFHHVVEQASGQGRIVHFQLGQDSGNCQGVHDVWLPGPASLPFMLFGGVGVGTTEQSLVGAWVIDPSQRDQSFCRSTT